MFNKAQIQLKTPEQFAIMRKAGRVVALCLEEIKTQIKPGMTTLDLDLIAREIMEKEEYFYRPALGEFAPSPNNGLFEILEDGRVFYDKFGRNFMRTIHRIRIFGLDTEKMMTTLKQSLDVILNTPPNPKEPEKYKDFSIVSNNCATIIQDVFNQCGFPEIKGRFPRDLFVNTTYHLFCHPELDVQYAKLPQLLVPEAPMSVVSPLLNFRNYFRKNELRIFESS